MLNRSSMMIYPFNNYLPAGCRTYYGSSQNSNNNSPTSHGKSRPNKPSSSSSSSSSSSDKYPINHGILHSRIRLIGEPSRKGDNNKSHEILCLEQALAIAATRKQDLVQVNEERHPALAVCKIFDYGRHVYDLKKKQKAQTESNNSSGTKAKKEKELQLGMKLAQHDLDLKIRKMKELLAKGHPVRISIKWKRWEAGLVPGARANVAKMLAIAEEHFNIRTSAVQLKANATSYSTRVAVAPGSGSSSSSTKTKPT